VASVSLDRAVRAPEPASAAPAEAGAPAGWNLAAAGAPGLWALGQRGEGVVVASVDTGVDPGHPDLAGRWRGGPGGWLDPHGEHATPHDASGHGTQTTAIAVGGAASGTAIGMAPDARWIAVKLFDDAGRARASDVHLALQWLLDPDGDPSTADAPDVVSAAWGLLDAAEACVDEFEPDLAVLRAAGIAVVFPAGNGGPEPASGVSPANNPGALSAGAVDAALEVAAFSSRGPSQCDGGPFPRLVAPGAGVVTADLAPGGLPLYATVTGTSYAAAHVAGALALLAGAFPAATAAELEDALLRSAVDLGDPGVDGAAGAGLVDARAAYDLLAASAAARGPAPSGGCSSPAGAASLLALAPALAAVGRRRRRR
jgi:bacillopeptidase F